MLKKIASNYLQKVAKDAYYNDYTPLYTEDLDLYDEAFGDYLRSKGVKTLLGDSDGDLIVELKNGDIKVLDHETGDLWDYPDTTKTLEDFKQDYNNK